MVNNGEQQTAEATGKSDSDRSYRYWAFISYSHDDEDWAAWLHKRLETYKAHQKLKVKDDRFRNLPDQLHPIFRDREELAADSDLPERIKEALEQSRFLVAVCSPKAAQSRWVNEEIQAFKALGREKQVLAFIVDGEPNAREKPGEGRQECFPAALRYKLDVDGQLSQERAEPIGADARKGKDGKRGALLKLIAGILRIQLDALKQRDQERRTSFIVTIAILMLVATVFTSGLAWYAFNQRDEARKQRAIADANSRRAESERTDAVAARLATEARTEINQNLDLSLLLARESTLVKDTTQTKEVFFAALTSNPHLVSFIHHETPLTSVAVSPDNKQLVSGSEDGMLQFWKLTDEQKRPISGPLKGYAYTPKSMFAKVRPETVIWSLRFSHNGKLLASGSQDGTVILWDAAEQKQLGEPIWQSEAEVSDIDFSPDGRLLAIASRDGVVVLWDIVQQTLYGTPFAGHRRGMTLSVAFSPDGKTLATGSGDATTRLWSVERQSPLTDPLGDYGAGILSIAFSPDGSLLALGMNEGTVLMWDVKRRKPRGEPLHGHKQRVPTVAFSTDGKLLASGSADRSIIIWDVASQKALFILQGHKDDVTGIAFSRKGNLLVSASGDGNVLLWDPSNENPLAKTIDAKHSFPKDLAFGPDGRTVVGYKKEVPSTVDNTLTLLFWDIRNGTKRTETLDAELETLSSGAGILGISGDGKLVAVVNRDSHISFWGIQAKKTIDTSLKVSGTHRQIAFGASNELFALKNDNDEIVVWSLPRLELVGTFRKPTVELPGDEISIVDFDLSPKDRILAAILTQKESLASAIGVSAHGTEDKVVVWEATNPTLTGEPITVPARIQGMKFSQDGKLLALASSQGEIFLLDIAKNKLIHRVVNREARFISKIAFDPDSKVLASGHQRFDQNGASSSLLCLWDIISQKSLGMVEVAHKKPITSLAFDPSGKQLITGSQEDSTMFMWNLDIESWREQACRIANRNLSCEEWRRYFDDDPYRATCPDLPVPRCEIIEKLISIHAAGTQP